jgi:hypothetical protein
MTAKRNRVAYRTTVLAERPLVTGPLWLHVLQQTEVVCPASLVTTLLNASDELNQNGTKTLMYTSIEPSTWTRQRA